MPVWTGRRPRRRRCSPGIRPTCCCIDRLRSRCCGVSAATDWSRPRFAVGGRAGNPRSLGALTRSLNASSVIDTLAEAPRIDYVHFGSCLFGNHANLERLLREARHLRWAAGYDVEIPWIESTAFDLMFWSKVDGSREDDETPRRQPHTGVADLLGYTDKLAERLGFRFHYQRGERVLCLPSGAQLRMPRGAVRCAHRHLRCCRDLWWSGDSQRRGR